MLVDEFLASLAVLVVVFLLTFLIEAFTEYIFGTVFDKVPKAATVQVVADVPGDGIRDSPVRLLQDRPDIYSRQGVERTRLFEYHCGWGYRLGCR